MKIDKSSLKILFWVNAQYKRKILINKIEKNIVFFCENQIIEKQKRKRRKIKENQ